MGDIKALVNDPRFRSLDPATQKSVLGQADARFQNLSDSDFKSFLDRAITPVSDRVATESLPRTLGGFQDAIKQSPSYHGHSDNPLLDSAKTAAGITSLVGLGLGGAGAIAGATLKGFLTSLVTGGVSGAAAGKAAKWLELPGWAQTAAELLGGAVGMAGSSKLGPLIQEYIETRPKGPVTGFIDFLRSKGATTEAQAVEKLIVEPTGVTGGTPIPSSGPSSYPPGDPNAEPGPGLWQKNGPSLPKEPNSRILVDHIPNTRTPPYGPAEMGPGYSGTQLPGATGRGSNSQTPLPQVPQARAIIEGPNPPTPSDYIFVGGEQYQIPGSKGILEAPGPTGKVPAKAPASSGPVLDERQQAALKVGTKILDTQDDKSRLIANYWKQQGINPTEVDEVAYRGHEKAVGKSPSKDVASSLARTKKIYESLGESSAPSESSNTQTGEVSPSLLEDTLKKSIKKAQSVESPKGIKASKGTTGKSPVVATPLAPVPSAPVETGTFTYDNPNPRMEFKRIGPGQWHARAAGTADPFTPSPIGDTLEESLINNELRRSE